MLKSSFSVEEKLLNAILRAKLNYMKMFLSNEMNCFFANAEDRFSLSLSFFAAKVHFRALNAQNHLFRASKNTNSVFSCH